MKIVTYSLLNRMRTLAMSFIYFRLAINLITQKCINMPCCTQLAEFAWYAGNFIVYGTLFFSMRIVWSSKLNVFNSS